MADIPDRVRQIDALLPQTQCRQCGYTGCRPYAEALATGGAQINQCPPGGDRVAHELAALFGVAFQPVDPRYGVTKPPATAVIDETTCIGCTLCIQACPVDAIVGAAKSMHTVIAAQCTGCELCVPPCPVDCIQILALPEAPTPTQRQAAADRARLNFERRCARLGRKADARRVSTRDIKTLTVKRALERARLRLAQRKSPASNRD